MPTDFENVVCDNYERHIADLEAKVEKLRAAGCAVLKAKADFEVFAKAGVLRGLVNERDLRKASEDAFTALAAAVE